MAALRRGGSMNILRLCPNAAKSAQNVFFAIRAANIFASQNSVLLRPAWQSGQRRPSRRSKCRTSTPPASIIMMRPNITRKLRSIIAKPQSIMKTTITRLLPTTRTPHLAMVIMPIITLRKLAKRTLNITAATTEENRWLVIGSPDFSFRDFCKLHCSHVCPKLTKQTQRVLPPD
jgi:hypothetical protein